MRRVLDAAAVRLRALFHTRRAEQELHDELRDHLARQVDVLVAAGMTPQAAEAEARRLFGGLAQAEEACRDARGVRLLHEFAQDAQYAIRMLKRTPALTVVLVLTLGVAMAANTAVFSIFNAVLLKALPFPDADRLVVITEERPNVPRGPVAYPDFLDWRAGQRSFDDLAASIVIGGVLTGTGEPERVFGRAVSAQFFATLGVPLALGRSFDAREDRPRGDRAMILGAALWRRAFGSDPAVVGRTVTYNGEPYTIVGVLPADFDFYGTANANNDIFVPLGHLAAEPYMQKRESHPVAVLGRIKRGVPIARAAADLDRIARRLASQYPATNAGVGVAVRSLLDDYVGDVKLTLWVLLVSAALVLAIASANIASVLLALASARSREMTTRLALGAGRARIARQVITETLLLGAMGGAAGILLGRWATSVLSSVAARTLPRVTDTSFDWRVMGFALAATAIAGLSFGIAPAWYATRGNLQGALSRGGRSVASTGRTRETLAVLEIALALALLVAAGLLVRSLSNLMRVDAGYDPTGVLTFRLRLPDADYRDPAKVAATLRATLSRIAAVPGVERACLTTGVPFGRTFPDRFEIAGQAAAFPLQQPLALTQWVSPEYFDTLRVRSVAGRTFTAADGEDREPVAIVDDMFVRTQFPGRTAASVLGEHVRFPATDARWRTIVGVVHHLRHGALDEEGRAEAYGPYDQLPVEWRAEIGRAIDVAVRSPIDPTVLLDAIKREVRSVSADVPLSHVRTLTDATALSVAPRVLNLWLVGTFAGAALLLCVVGVYGVMSYSVAERTREIAVRLAIGAEPATIMNMVVTRGARLALAGTAIGLALAFAAGRFLRTLLFGVASADPVTFAMGTGVLVIVAIAASSIPARRAMRLDPIVALRDH